MSSPAVDLRGVQEPRVALLPDAVWSDADDAAFLASSYGLTPDPWQLEVLRGWLGRTADGRLSATRCGLAVPRQNGKNGCLEVRELFGVVVRGEKFLHTAHEVKTARKAFLRLVSFFENPHFPELVALVKDVRRTNGQEAILLTNGGSVEFVARSRGSGRGFTVDVLVLDEAQELTDEQLEALMPTISAAPLGDPQIVLTGTPPPPGSPGEVFVRTRKRAHDGDSSRLCWHEWGVESGDVDVHDRRVWADVNPALGFRLLTTTIEDELGTMSDDGFLRERLGLWPEVDVSKVVDMARWASLVGVESERPSPVALGLTMSADRKWTTIALAGVRSDGHKQVQVVQSGKGSAWVADRVVELVSAHSPVAVAVDPSAPEGSLIGALRDAGVMVETFAGQRVAQGCGAFVDAVAEGSLRHSAQTVLTMAVDGARRVRFGGLWVFGDGDAVDVSPLRGVVLALLALGSVRSQKKRSGKVW